MQKRKLIPNWIGETGLLAFCGILAGAAGADAQRIQIRPAQEVYTSSDLTCLSDSQHHTVTPNPNTPSPPYQKGFFFDGEFIPIRTSFSTTSATMRFIYSSGNGGIDVWDYAGAPNDAFTDPLGVHSATATYSSAPIVTINADGKTAKDVLWIGGVALLGVAPPNTPADQVRPNNVTTLRRSINSNAPPLGWPQMFRYYYDRAWIASAYRDPATNDLLGLVHIETSVASMNDGEYTIGIAYSLNANGNINGKTWVYCGDIIKARNHISERTDNITGIPYLVVGGYFYVYYCDFPNPNWCVNGTCPSFGRRACVARGNLSNVLARARAIYQARVNRTVNDTGLITSAKPDVQSPAVEPFYKCTNIGSDGTPTWDNQTAITEGELGADILQNRLPNMEWVDFHSHAAYCKALNRYLLLVCNGDAYSSANLNPYRPGTLVLYTSVDAINWTGSQVVDATSPTSGPYIEKAMSFFVSLDADQSGNPMASADCDTVGSRFYIFTPYMYYGTYTDKNGQQHYCQQKHELWKHKVTIVPPPKAY
jgi:hypothetical protein